VRDMSKAKIFIELEIDVNKENPNDKSLSLHEIADNACGGAVNVIKNELKKNKRNPKVIKARYEYTIKKSCLD
jgi:hypothetical protein